MDHMRPDLQRDLHVRRTGPRSDLDRVIDSVSALPTWMSSGGSPCETPDLQIEIGTVRLEAAVFGDCVGLPHDPAGVNVKRDHAAAEGAVRNARSDRGAPWSKNGSFLLQSSAEVVEDDFVLPFRMAHCQTRSPLRITELLRPLCVT